MSLPTRVLVKLRLFDRHDETGGGRRSRRSLFGVCGRISAFVLLAVRLARCGELLQEGHDEGALESVTRVRDGGQIAVFLKSDVSLRVRHGQLRQLAPLEADGRIGARTTSGSP